MTSHTHKKVGPDNRATIPHTGIAKWIEPTEQQATEAEDFIPHFRNRSEYFDKLHEAIAGLTALMTTEVHDAKLLQQAKQEVKKIETEKYDMVREYLGADVTDQMQQINNDLDELASLVSGIEASLAGFTPLIDEENAQGERDAA